MFYLFPPFSDFTSCFQKLIHQDKTEALSVAPYWKTQVWYPVLPRSLVRPPILVEENKYNLLQPCDPNFVHPLTCQHNENYGSSCIRRHYQNLGILQEATEIIMGSWRDGTKCQYQRYVKKCFEYCEINRINISSPPIKDVTSYRISNNDIQNRDTVG